MSINTGHRIARFTLALALVAGSVHGASADENEIEPNGACPGNWIQKDTRVHGALAAGGDVDWFAFDAVAGDRITVGTEPDPGLGEVDTILEIFAYDCTTSLAWDDDQGPGHYALISDLLAPYTGAYYAKVRAFHGLQSGAYALVASAVPVPGGGQCPLDPYEVRTSAGDVAIPDGIPIGTETGSLAFEGPAARFVTDVVVELEIDHERVGDLDAILLYEEPGEGTVKVSLLLSPQLPGGAPCGAALVADGSTSYTFGADPTLVPLGENCPAVVPGGCYAIAPGSVNGLEALRGRPVSGGSWRLRLADDERGAGGVLRSWSVYLLSETPPVSVRPTSWGAIKATYR